MVISEPGLICLEASEHHLVRGFVALWFGARDTPANDAYPRQQQSRFGAAAAPADPGRAGAGQTAIVMTAGSEPAIAREGELNVEAGECEESAPLTAQERRARAAALRGLLLGRQRRFGAAQAAFADALRLDATLSLESVPTFWNLERGAHEAAVRAYEEAGRKHEAAMLASRLRTTFRPRLLSPRSTTATSAG